LARILKPDLSTEEKVRPSKENMPTESMTAGREAAMISLLNRLGRVVQGDDRQAGIGEVAEMLRGFRAAGVRADPTGAAATGSGRDPSRGAATTKLAPCRVH
jgi:hypothetical protein